MSEIRVKKNHYFRKSLYLITTEMRNPPCFSAKIKILGPKSGNFPLFHAYILRKSSLLLQEKLACFDKKTGYFHPKVPLKRYLKPKISFLRGSERQFNTFCDYKRHPILSQFNPLRILFSNALRGQSVYFNPFKTRIFSSPL